MTPPLPLIATQTEPNAATTARGKPPTVTRACTRPVDGSSRSSVGPSWMTTDSEPKPEVTAIGNEPSPLANKRTAAARPARVRLV